MSLTVSEKLNPVTVWDPRTVAMPMVYPVVKGGSDVLYKAFTTTSISNSSINFSCPPTSQNVWVDRRVHIQMPVRITVQATGMPAGALLFNPNQVAIRSFPVMKSLDTMQLTLNNQSVSVNISDIMSAVEHFNIDRKLKAIDYSKCPTYSCSQSQEFYDLFGATRSPMSLYGDGLDDLASASFPFTIVSQTNVAGLATSTIDFISTEPIFLSPLFWGAFCHDDSAFYGLRTFDMTLNFLNTANRMLALDNVSVGVPFAPTTITSTMSFSNFSPAFSYAQSQPYLLFQYITPQLADKGANLSKVFNYPYFNIDRFPTDVPSIAAGASSQISSNNIQLNSIPSRMYIFARNTNASLYATPFLTDTFLAIENISIQFGNRSGVLASASKRQLFDLSAKNGCNLSWQQWSGEQLNSPALASAGFGTAAKQYAACGSILCLDMIDIGLESLDAPGKLAQLMLQINVNVKNVSKAAILPTLYVVCVSQGLFSIFNGQCSSLIGVLTSNDILNSHAETGHHMLTYEDVRVINGGNFLSGWKTKLLDIWKKVKPYAKLALKGVNLAAPFIGLGEGEGYGGDDGGEGVHARGVSAGARMNRKTLRHRLH